MLGGWPQARATGYRQGKWEKTKQNGMDEAQAFLVVEMIAGALAIDDGAHRAISSGGFVKALNAQTCKIHNG